MSSTPCAAEDCTRPTVARNLCPLHYSRWRVSQSPPCVIEDCSKPSKSGGLCNAHYIRKRLHGDPGAGTIKSIRALDHPDGTRTCSRCGERKPLGAYHQDKRASLGRRNQCRTCHTAHVKAWYADNQERQLDRARARAIRDGDKIRANDLKRYERDREKRIALATAAMHARRVRMREGRYVPGITWNALRDRDGDRCCYCDIVMDFERIPGIRYNPKRATIEHLIPVSAGGAHDWDNVTLACHQCNLRRNRMPLDQWLAKLDANPRDADSGSAPKASAASPHHPEPS